MDTRPHWPPDNPTDPEYLRSCVTIDESDLLAEYTRTPADLAYWAQVAADRELDYQLAKEHRAHVEATAVLAALANGFKSEHASRAAAAANSLVVEAGERLAKAAAARSHAKSIVDAIRTKSSMLVTMGADRRAELRGGL